MTKINKNKIFVGKSKSNKRLYVEVKIIDFVKVWFFSTSNCHIDSFRDFGKLLDRIEFLAGSSKKAIEGLA